MSMSSVNPSIWTRPLKIVLNVYLAKSHMTFCKATLNNRWARLFPCLIPVDSKSGKTSDWIHISHCVSSMVISISQISYRGTSSSLNAPYNLGFLMMFYALWKLTNKQCVVILSSRDCILHIIIIRWIRRFIIITLKYFPVL